jgi:hypothetical protein
LSEFVGGHISEDVDAKDSFTTSGNVGSVETVNFL